MKKNWKKLFCRLLAGTMAGVLLMGTAGCKGGEKEEKEKEVVMGRYLEEEIPLPEGAQGIVEATRLSDGKLALLGYDEQYMTHYWQSADDGETWEEQGNMPQELKLADGEQQTAMSVGAIRQDGAVLCVVTTYDVDTAGCSRRQDLYTKYRWNLHRGQYEVSRRFYSGHRHKVVVRSGSNRSGFRCRSL